MNDIANIEGKVDRGIAGEISISRSEGGVTLRSGAEMMEFAKLMSVAKGAVPKHLRGEPGMCLAICVQATNWRMDPFAVAQKSYFVSDRIAYEAQLVQAVIEQRAPIKGRIKGEFIGEGASRQCVLRVVSAEDGDEIVYTSPEIGKITTKNSPLWKADPDQQLWYYSARAMCRRHFPDVLLGVYAQDELDGPARIRDVTPEKQEGRDRLQQLMRGEKPEDPPPADEPAPDAEDAEIVGEPEVDESSVPYGEGRVDFENFGDAAICPEDYAEGSPERINWMAGMRDAKDEKENEG